MANNYLLFSEATPQLKARELAWFRSQLEMIYVVGGKEYTDQDDFHEDQIEWSGPRAYRDMPDYDPDFDEGAGFLYEVFDTSEDRSVWFYSEEYGSVERVAHLMWKFLKTFRPRKSWALTFATTCSRPRVGEFGGGAVFITARRITWNNAHAMVERCQRAFERRNGPRRPRK